MPTTDSLRMPRSNWNYDAMENHSFCTWNGFDLHTRRIPCEKEYRVRLVGHGIDFVTVLPTKNFGAAELFLMGLATGILKAKGYLTDRKMQLYQEVSEKYLAIQIADADFDDEHSNDAHVPGAVYDPITKTVSIHNITGHIGDYIVRSPEVADPTTVWIWTKNYFESLFKPVVDIKDLSC